MPFQFFLSLFPLSFFFPFKDIIMVLLILYPNTVSLPCPAVPTPDLPQGPQGGPLPSLASSTDISNSKSGTGEGHKISVY